ncbi:MAG: anaerobic ribonucleoside-triphosphate reductase activating protein [Candidatus Aenigmatarchaeota archaeon]
MIRGIQKVSFIDWPGKVCTVLFVGGCNFRCPFCQNPELVLSPENLPNISEDELMAFLKERQGWIDGVCITGGEPTIWAGLPQLVQKIKSLGLGIKLDTNGSMPDVIEKMIDKKMLDYIAMDIKGPIEKYEKITRTNIDTEKIKRSVELIRKSGIPYEFRSTVLPKLHSKEDILKIAKWLKGAERFVLQQFRPEKTIDPAFQAEKPFTKEELEEFKKALKPYFKIIEVRA